MATLNPQQIIAPQHVANATTTYYTVGANSITVVRRITLSNVTAGAITVDFYYVPVSGAAGISNQFLKSYSIAANTSVAPAVLEGIVLEAGDTIQISASAANSITVIGSGTEVSG